MAPELNRQNIQAIQNTISNMMLDEKLRPQGSESLFLRLEKNSESAAGVEQALAETKRSMNNLMDQRSKLIGAIDTVSDIIAEALTDKEIQKYGAKVIQQEQEASETPVVEGA